MASINNGESPSGDSPRNVRETRLGMFGRLTPEYSGDSPRNVRETYLGILILNDAASSDENIMPAVLEAVENHVTLGEIADTLREVYGEYK